jgi:hypothetical protein
MPLAIIGRARRARGSSCLWLLLTVCAATCAGVKVVPPDNAVPTEAKAPAGDPRLELDRYIPAGGVWKPLAAGAGGPPRLMLGTRFRVCATPPEEGYVRLVVAADGKQLYPVAGEHGPDRSLHVSAGVRICMGDDAQLVVDKPFGRTQVQYLFSHDASLQPAARGLAVPWLVEYEAVPP